MVFQLARTFSNPSDSQSGFATPGAGAQRAGKGKPPAVEAVGRNPVRPIQGLFSWLFPSAPQDAQRGFPAPEAPEQARPRGSMPNGQTPFGGVYQHETPYYSRGAAAFVPNFGLVLTNPIGAGVQALYRPQASYGPAAQYDNGAIWWTSQAIPTSVNLQGLQDPAALEAILSDFHVYGEIQTTG